MPPTGPRTPEGKARSSRNAVKHGLLAAKPILDGKEDAALWEAHREGVYADFQPVGASQCALVEEIASLLWRKNRAPQVEADALTATRESLPPLVPNARPLDGSPIENLDQLRAAITRMRILIANLNRLDQMPDGECLSAEEWREALIPLHDVYTRVHPDADYQQITAGLQARLAEEPECRGRGRRLFHRIARHYGELLGRTEDEVLNQVWTEAESRLGEYIFELGRHEPEDERRRRSRLTVNLDALSKLARYEGHLGRELTRALRTLADLQSATPTSTPPSPTPTPASAPELPYPNRNPHPNPPQAPPTPTPTPTPTPASAPALPYPNRNPHPNPPQASPTPTPASAPSHPSDPSETQFCETNSAPTSAPALPNRNPHPNPPQATPPSTSDQSNPSEPPLCETNSAFAPNLPDPNRNHGPNRPQPPPAPLDPNRKPGCNQPQPPFPLRLCAFARDSFPIRPHSLHSRIVQIPFQSVKSVAPTDARFTAAHSRQYSPKAPGEPPGRHINLRLGP